MPWVVGGCAAVAALGTALGPGSIEVETGFRVTNPFGIDVLGPIVEPIGSIGWIGLFAAIPVSILSLVLRYRRSAGEARQQIRWLVFVGIAVVSSLVVTAAAAIIGRGAFERSIGPSVAFGVIFSLIAVGVPAAIGIAILKYRLYDLDLVIKKTVVYAILAIFVFGLGTALAWVAAGFLFWSSEGNAYSFLVTGLAIGVAIWPLRRLATRIANRLVYGRRATPYQVLTEFSGRLAESYAADDVLERMARVLAAAVGAEAATVWLRVGRSVPSRRDVARERNPGVGDPRGRGRGPASG